MLTLASTVLLQGGFEDFIERIFGILVFALLFIAPAIKAALDKKRQQGGGAPQAPKRPAARPDPKPEPVQRRELDPWQRLLRGEEPEPPPAPAPPPPPPRPVVRRSQLVPDQATATPPMPVFSGNSAAAQGTVVSESDFGGAVEEALQLSQMRPDVDLPGHDLPGHDLPGLAGPAYSTGAAKVEVQVSSVQVSRTDWRRALILAEVLGPPVSERTEEPWLGTAPGLR